MKNTYSLFNRLIWILGLGLVLVLGGCTTSDSSLPATTELPPPAPESYRSVPINPELADFSFSALNFVSRLRAGWNLGNTLDAHVDGKTGLSTETSWDQPKTTQAMMAGLKASGITTVRIPITWHNHVDAAFTIDHAWMNRVIEVVEYALDADLYVIINIHHDDKKGFIYPDNPHAARSTEYVKRIWKQISLMFRNYDERLIFEILNEPRLKGTANEWVWSNNNSMHRDAAKIIGEMTQAALDEIRSSGGNNENRFVMITPYVASPQAAMSNHFVIPEDTAKDKLILSVHAYTPYVFAMQDPGDKIFTTAHKADIDNFMGQLNTKFIQGKGMPVIIGEYGATDKRNIDQRVAWFSYYCEKAASYGMSTILWDNGHHTPPLNGPYNEQYGFYDRRNSTATTPVWFFQEILNEIVNAYIK